MKPQNILVIGVAGYIGLHMGRILKKILNWPPAHGLESIISLAWKWETGKVK